MSIERNIDFYCGGIFGSGQLQAADPFLHPAPGGSAGKPASGKPIRTAGQRVQVGVAGADTAGVGGAEGNDSLSGKVVAF